MPNECLLPNGRESCPKNKSVAPAGFYGKFPRLWVRAGIDGPNPEERSTDMKVKTNVRAGEWLMTPAGSARP